MVLVILIALWAMVLLPPYLKDRRASGRAFRSIQSGGINGGLSGIGGGINSAQRFLPLQQASTAFSTSAVTSPTGMRSTGVTSLGSSSNVVHLRPVEAEPAPHVPQGRAPLATSAAAYLEESPVADESALHQAWETSSNAGLGMPTSTASARERRRQVLLGMTGLALFTLMMAIFSGGRWVAAHVFVDVLMVGYVILLVRHRQLMADRMMKVEPIRPPVSEQAPTSVQIAPSYLLRSSTGS